MVQALGHCHTADIVLKDHGDGKGLPDDPGVQVRPIAAAAHKARTGPAHVAGNSHADGGDLIHRNDTGIQAPLDQPDQGLRNILLLRVVRQDHRVFYIPPKVADRAGQGGIVELHPHYIAIVRLDIQGNAAPADGAPVLLHFSQLRQDPLPQQLRHHGRNGCGGNARQVAGILSGDPRVPENALQDPVPIGGSIFLLFVHDISLSLSFGKGESRVMNGHLDDPEYIQPPFLRKLPAPDEGAEFPESPVRLFFLS